MTTPSYLGEGQPGPGTTGDGWLARLGSYFGNGGTPAYVGNGQPSPIDAGGLLRGATPAYRTAPVMEPIEQAQAPEPSTVQAADETAMACPIDPDALAAGHIAIVIPRERRDP